MVRFSWVLFVSLCASSAFGNSNACDDYLMRHYRKNLKPISITYQNKDYMGDIYFPHQAVSLKVKSMGEVAFPATASGFKPISVKVGSQSQGTQVPVPIPSGTEKFIKFNLAPNTLKHCQNATVTIDTLHNVGQWGCLVWNDDSSVLKAREANGTFCLNIQPWIEGDEAVDFDGADENGAE